MSDMPAETPPAMEMPAEPAAPAPATPAAHFPTMMGAVPQAAAK